MKTRNALNEVVEAFGANRSSTLCPNVEDRCEGTLQRAGEGINLPLHRPQTSSAASAAVSKLQTPSSGDLPVCQRVSCWWIRIVTDPASAVARSSPHVSKEALLPTVNENNIPTPW